MKRATPEYDQRDIDTGKAAEAFLAAEPFQAALERARQRIMDQWINAATPQAREELHGRIVGINLVVVELMTAAGSGKQAQHLKDKAVALP